MESGNRLEGIRCWHKRNSHEGNIHSNVERTRPKKAAHTNQKIYVYALGEKKILVNHIAFAGYVSASSSQKR